MLSLHSVTKSYSTVTAVDHLSFSVKSGEIFALLGPNGAGKTTTIRMIMGIIEPDSGSLEFEAGIDRSRLGYLPEERGLYQDVSIAETLLYLASLRSSDKAGIKARAKDWLNRFGLYDRRNDKLSTLSKGNQQKIQFIASVLHQPAFAVLDEPFSGFDPINQDVISGIIRELSESGMTILLSAHQMQLIERIADRILLINHGREHLSGTMSEIRAKTLSGRKWTVTFATPVDAASIVSIREIDHAEPDENGAWTVLCAGNADINRVLAHLSGVAPISDLSTSDITLHDIFIQKFSA